VTFLPGTGAAYEVAAALAAPAAFGAEARDRSLASAG
jgi:hypothetical protein